MLMANADGANQFRNTYNSDYNSTLLAGSLRMFPYPLVTFEVPPGCECTVVYAPRMSGDKSRPMVLKYRHGNCSLGGHRG